MSTLRTTNIQHPSSDVPAIVLDAVDGVTFSAASFDAAVITSGVLDVARVPLAAGIGSNVVQTVKTDTFSTSSGTFTGVTGLTVTITPSATLSKVLILAQIMIFSNQTSGASFNVQFSGGNTSSYIGDASGSQVRTAFGAGSNFAEANYVSESVILSYLDSPNTTSPVTYGLEVRRGSGGTVFVNRSAATDNAAYMSRGASSITVIEVAA